MDNKDGTITKIKNESKITYQKLLEKADYKDNKDGRVEMTSQGFLKKFWYIDNGDETFTEKKPVAYSKVLFDISTKYNIELSFELNKNIQKFVKYTVAAAHNKGIRICRLLLETLNLTYKQHIPFRLKQLTESEKRKLYTEQEEKKSPWGLLHQTIFTDTPLLFKNSDLFEKSKYGCTLLYLLAITDRLENLKFVLKLIDKYFHPVKNTLLESKMDANKTPLELAFCFGKIREVALLIDAGAEFNKSLLFERTEDDESLLHIVAAYGSVYSLMKILSIIQSKKDEPKNPRDLENYCGQTPLHRYLSECNTDLRSFTALLTGDNFDLEDADGFTPLLLASQCEGMREISRILVLMGADCTYTKHNAEQSPLEQAIENKDISLVSMMLAGNIDLKELLSMLPGIIQSDYEMKELILSYLKPSQFCELIRKAIKFRKDDILILLKKYGKAKYFLNKEKLSVIVDAKKLGDIETALILQGRITRYGSKLFTSSSSIEESLSDIETTSTEETDGSGDGDESEDSDFLSVESSITKDKLTIDTITSFPLLISDTEQSKYRASIRLKNLLEAIKNKSAIRYTQESLSHEYSHHETISDGNCALNAFALGLLYHKQRGKDLFTNNEQFRLVFSETFTIDLKVFSAELFSDLVDALIQPTINLKHPLIKRILDKLKNVGETREGLEINQLNQRIVLLRNTVICNQAYVNGIVKPEYIEDAIRCLAVRGEIFQLAMALALRNYCVKFNGKFNYMFIDEKRKLIPGEELLNVSSKFGQYLGSTELRFLAKMFNVKIKENLGEFREIQTHGTAELEIIVFITRPGEVDCHYELVLPTRAEFLDNRLLMQNVLASTKSLIITATLLKGLSNNSSSFFSRFKMAPAILQRVTLYTSEEPMLEEKTLKIVCSIIK